MQQTSVAMLNALANLTTLQDRDALAFSLCLTLAEVFNLNKLDFYHCRPTHSLALWQINHAIRLENDHLTHHWAQTETIASDSPNFEPLLKSAFHADEGLAQSLDGCRLVRRLTINNRPQVLLDCHAKVPFIAKDLRALLGMTRIYENHIALLDYGETDTLTGLLNRKTLERHFQKVMEYQQKCAEMQLQQAIKPEIERRAPPEDEAYSVAVMDIDHFKRINDQFGHIYGDEVLLLVAQLMQASFRDNDYLFRFGGEEFVVLIGPQSEQSAHRAVERFRLSVAEHSFPQVGQVTISIGLTRLMAQDVLSGVLERADEALYQAKTGGRNRTVIATINPHSVPSGSIEFF